VIICAQSSSVIVSQTNYRINISMNFTYTVNSLFPIQLKPTEANEFVCILEERICSLLKLLVRLDNASLVGLCRDSLLIILHRAVKVLHCTMIANPETCAHIL
jgi:hypothetical protein